MKLGMMQQASSRLFNTKGVANPMFSKLFKGSSSTSMDKEAQQAPNEMIPGGSEVHTGHAKSHRHSTHTNNHHDGGLSDIHEAARPQSGWVPREADFQEGTPQYDMLITQITDIYIEHNPQALGKTKKIVDSYLVHAGELLKLNKLMRKKYGVGVRVFDFSFSLIDDNKYE